MTLADDLRRRERVRLAHVAIDEIGRLAQAERTLAVLAYQREQGDAAVAAGRLSRARARRTSCLRAIDRALSRLVEAE